ncbi:hypothetical protein ACFL4O_00490 [bacterium]
MKQTILRLLMLFMLMFFSGCIGLRPLLSPIVKKGIPFLIKPIPVTEKSTLSVIYFSHYNVGGQYGNASDIKLGFYKKGMFFVLDVGSGRIYKKEKSKLIEIIRIKSKTVTVGTRMYLFNVPAGKYYIFEIYPTLKFKEEDFEQYPLIIEKGEFNILGRFKPKRKNLFTNKGKLTEVGCMNREKERTKFLTLFGKNNPWADFLDIKNN